MKPVDINKLLAIIVDKSKTPHEEMLYRDTFAAVCYLHLKGHEEVALKLCRALIDHLDLKGRKPNFFDLKDTLAGNESAYGHGIRPHSEFEKLFVP